MVCVWVTHGVRSLHVVIPLATTATDSVLRTSITITSVQCRAVLALLYHLGRCVKILNTTNGRSGIRLWVRHPSSSPVTCNTFVYLIELTQCSVAFVLAKGLSLMLLW